MDNLTIIKNSLGIISDDFDDELKGYLEASKSYINATLSENKVAIVQNDMRFTVAVQQLAIYLWQTRGDSSAPKNSLPFTLQSLINNLSYN